jgi:hypothetical protein
VFPNIVSSSENTTGIDLEVPFDEKHHSREADQGFSHLKFPFLLIAHYVSVNNLILSLPLELISFPSFAINNN